MVSFAASESFVVFLPRKNMLVLPAKIIGGNSGPILTILFILYRLNRSGAKINFFRTSLGELPKKLIESWIDGRLY